MTILWIRGGVGEAHIMMGREEGIEEGYEVRQRDRGRGQCELNSKGENVEYQICNFKIKQCGLYN